MSDKKALARKIAKRKPARIVVAEKPARMRRLRVEGDGAALRFIFWNDPKGIDL